MRFPRFLFRSMRVFVSREEGQFIPTLMTAFVLGWSLFVGMALDLSNLKIHQQMATYAAEAACNAGTQDMYWVAQSDENWLVAGNYLLPTITPPDSEPPYLASFEAAPTGFQISNDPTDFSANVAGQTISGTCDTGNDSTVAMCAYAAANGYSPSKQGDEISWELTGSPGNIMPVNPGRRFDIASYIPQDPYPNPSTVVPYGILPYLHVQVSEKVHTYLLDLWPGMPKELTVVGICHCGLGGIGKQIIEHQTQLSNPVNVSKACMYMPMQMPTLPSISYSCDGRDLKAMAAKVVDIQGSKISGGTLKITCPNCNTKYFSGETTSDLSYSCDGGSTYTSLESVPFSIPASSEPTPISEISASCPGGQDMMLSVNVFGGGTAQAYGSVGPSKESWDFLPPPDVLASFSASTGGGSQSGTSVTATAYQYVPFEFGTN